MARDYRSFVSPTKPMPLPIVSDVTVFSQTNRYAALAALIVGFSFVDEVTFAPARAELKSDISRAVLYTCPDKLSPANKYHNSSSS